MNNLEKESRSAVPKCTENHWNVSIKLSSTAFKSPSTTAYYTDDGTELFFDQQGLIIAYPSFIQLLQSDDLQEIIHQAKDEFAKYKQEQSDRLGNQHHHQQQQHQQKNGKYILFQINNCYNKNVLFYYFYLILGGVQFHLTSSESDEHSDNSPQARIPDDSDAENECENTDESIENTQIRDQDSQELLIDENEEEDTNDTDSVEEEIAGNNLNGESNETFDTAENNDYGDEDDDDDEEIELLKKLAIAARIKKQKKLAAAALAASTGRSNIPPPIPEKKKLDSSARKRVIYSRPTNESSGLNEEENEESNDIEIKKRKYQKIIKEKKKLNTIPPETASENSTNINIKKSKQ